MGDFTEADVLLSTQWGNHKGFHSHMYMNIPKLFDFKYLKAVVTSLK